MFYRANGSIVNHDARNWCFVFMFCKMYVVCLGNIEGQFICLEPVGDFNQFCVEDVS